MLESPSWTLLGCCDTDRLNRVHHIICTGILTNHYIDEHYIITFLYTWDTSNNNYIDEHYIVTFLYTWNISYNTTHSGPHLGFEYNFLFSKCPSLGVRDNLGLKCPADFCKQVVFAAGVQKKPKRCRAIKVARGP